MRLYLLLDRLGRPRSYLGKVLLVGFLGIHMPLAAATLYLLAHDEVPIGEVAGLLMALLLATLLGTIVTLACLSALLLPVRDAGEEIADYLQKKSPPQLPTTAQDEVGRLLAGVQEVLTRLESAHVQNQTQSEESRSRFALISAMSHELRTPLNHIMGFADVIATEALGPLGQKSYRTYAADIGASGGKLLSVLQTLIEFSDIAASEGRLKPTINPVAENLQNAAAAVHQHARAAQVDVRLSAPATLTVFADPRVFKQILLHSLVSAVESAGAHRIVRVIAYGEGGASQIEIAHDGRPWLAAEIPAAVLASSPEIGVPANDAPIRSATTESLRLSLVHSLCAASGGRIAAKPGRNGGRMLRLTLPAVDGVTLKRTA